jgi:hypothetical protein
MMRSQKFFNKVSSHYQDLIPKRGSKNQINIHQDIVELLIGERVLNIRNVGTRKFYPHKLHSMWALISIWKC